MKPQRMCITCRARRDKDELLRIVKNSEGQIRFDENGKLPGRGAYLCLARECIEKAVKQKRLNRAFRGAVDDSIYELLTGLQI